MKQIESLRLDLARHFCEDKTSFKIDDCISTFNAFCQKFLRAVEVGQFHCVCRLDSRDNMAGKNPEVMMGGWVG